MKKIWIAVALIAVAGIFFAFKAFTPRVNTPSSSPKPVDFIATFEIYTLGTKRTFDDTKYHNLNDNVYISPLDPQYVHLKKTSITWQNFFDTLPMKLTKECLTTGTGQVFCTNQTRKLIFTLNNLEDKDALDKEITPGAKLLIEYK